MKKFVSAEKKQLAALAVICLICLALLIWLSILFMPFFSHLSDPAFLQKLERWINSVGLGGWFFILGIQILQIIVAFIPGGPVEILAGVLFGAWGGMFTCLLGILVASAAIFFTVRKFGSRLVVRLFGRERVREFKFLNNAKRVETVTFLLFLIPGFPKDMLTYLAGISKIRPLHFLLISTFARLPALITATTMGATMSRGSWFLTLLVFLLTAAVGLVSIRYKDRLLAHFRQVPEES